MLVFDTAANPHRDASVSTRVTADFCVVRQQLLMLGGRHGVNVSQIKDFAGGGVRYSEEKSDKEVRQLIWS